MRSRGDFSLYRQHRRAEARNAQWTSIIHLAIQTPVKTIDNVIRNLNCEVSGGKEKGALKIQQSGKIMATTMEIKDPCEPAQ